MGLNGGMGGRPARLPPGPWKDLLGHALRLIDETARRGGEPFWTLGGGTVLMLRYQHRRSKDIDIFVPDPQVLGHVSPRLSDLAEAIADDYVEAATFVKLTRAEGEIDVPPRQNSCRLHRPTQGAAMKDGLGSIRTGIQRQGGGEVAAAGERNA